MKDRVKHPLDVPEGVLLVGVTGGIASGKSYVASQFATHGAFVIDADKLGHAALADPPVIDAIRARFGDRVIDSDGSVLRRALAGRVFAGDEATEINRRDLIAITHPHIAAAVNAKLLNLASNRVVAASRRTVVILDAPLLIEADWHTACDELVFVDANLAVRQARAMQRGWSPADFAAREATQVDPATKKSLATQIVFNDDDASPEMATTIAVIWRQFLDRATNQENMFTTGV